MGMWVSVWKEKCPLKGLSDFNEDCLEHMLVFFAWVSLEGRNSFCHAMGPDSVVALSIADPRTPHPAHVGKHSLMGVLTP